MRILFFVLSAIFVIVGIFLMKSSVKIMKNMSYKELREKPFNGYRINKAQFENLGANLIRQIAAQNGDVSSSIEADERRMEMENTLELARKRVKR